MLLPFFKVDLIDRELERGCDTVIYNKKFVGLCSISGLGIFQVKRVINLSFVSLMRWHLDYT